MRTLFTVIIVAVLAAGAYLLASTASPVPVPTGGSPTTVGATSTEATSSTPSTPAPLGGTTNSGAQTGGSSERSATIETKIDQGASALGVKVIPHEVIEDSRCPVDVQCIWAGRLRVSATLESGLGSANQEFTLGQPITTESEIVTLTEVLPVRHQATNIENNDYTFIFRIQKR